MRPLTICFAFAVCLGATINAFAQAPVVYQPRRTPDGQPDFQGVWSTRWTTPLERPQNLQTLALSPAEGAGLHRAVLSRLASNDPLGPTYAWDLTGPLVIAGEARSSLIVDPADGLLPYTEEGRTLRNSFVTPFSGDDGPEQRSPNERCLMSGGGYAPFLSVPVGNIRQIVQTRDTIVFHTEGFNQLRIVPVDGRSGPAIPRGGSSAGRWDNDTLVVETARFLESDRFRFAPGSVIPISPATLITERFTMVAPNALLYSFTISDPLIYARPWTGESLLTRTDDRMFEFSCHEGNRGLAGILSGARAMEREATNTVSNRTP